MIWSKNTLLALIGPFKPLFGPFLALFDPKTPLWTLKMTSDDMMTLGMGEEADNIPSGLRQP